MAGGVYYGDTCGQFRVWNGCQPYSLPTDLLDGDVVGIQLDFSVFRVGYTYDNPTTGDTIGLSYVQSLSFTDRVLQLNVDPSKTFAEFGSTTYNTTPQENRISISRENRYMWDTVNSKPDYTRWVQWITSLEYFKFTPISSSTVKYEFHFVTYRTIDGGGANDYPAITDYRLNDDDAPDNIAQVITENATTSAGIPWNSGYADLNAANTSWQWNDVSTSPYGLVSGRIRLRVLG